MPSPDKKEDTDEPILLEITSPSGRIVLRQFSLADVDDVFALIDASREHLSQYGDVTAGKYQTSENVAESMRSPKNPQRLRFAIRAEDDKYVGSINLTPDEGNPTSGEIGIYLGAETTDHGYATEATTTLSDYAFTDLGYELVYALVHPDNAPSARVLERAVYTHERDEEGERVFVLGKPEEE